MCKYSHTDTTNTLICKEPTAQFLFLGYTRVAYLTLDLYAAPVIQTTADVLHIRFENSGFIKVESKPKITFTRVSTVPLKQMDLNLCKNSIKKVSHLSSSHLDLNINGFFLWLFLNS